MKLIPVDAIPKVSGYHKLQDLIEEFVNGDAKIVKVDFGEDDYKSPTVCRSCLSAAIKRSKRSVKVWRRGNEVFLSKDIWQRIEPPLQRLFLLFQLLYF